MRLPGWQFAMGGLLVAFSAVLYLLQYFLFRTPRDITYYFFQDLAFLPIEVMLVTLVLHRLLNRRERRVRLNKTNTVIGAFFNDTGTGLIERYVSFLPESVSFGDHLLVSGKWTSHKFETASAALKGQDFGIDSRRGDLEEMNRFLSGKKEFLLRLLESPSLLEHDTFTDLLWAVFHLADELDHRPEFAGLPEADFDHLTVDLQRAWALLLSVWLSYMHHLKREYPYLFSLAMRTSPFDPRASAVVR